MKLKNATLIIAAFALSLSLLPQTAVAQTSLGASYEIRDEDPQNGFGVRLEKGILNKVPIVNLALRGHFSFFSEENSISRDDGTTSISYSQDITNYDYGVAAVGGVSLGLLSPYVGLGLGASTLDVTREDLGGVSVPQESNDSSIYWNGFIGAKVSPLPYIKPFVEYRFEDVADYEDELDDVRNSSGRLIFGVSLSF